MGTQISDMMMLMIGVLQMGQPLGMYATASAQLEQKRECPRGTRATPEQTTHTSSYGVGVAAGVVTVAVAGGVESTSSSSSLLSSEVNWNASV